MIGVRGTLRSVRQKELRVPTTATKLTPEDVLLATVYASNPSMTLVSSPLLEKPTPYKMLKIYPMIFAFLGGTIHVSKTFAL